MANVFVSTLIPKVGPWSEPNGLRSIATGNPMGTSGHLPPTEDLADAIGWLWAVVTGQETPSVGGGVATLGGDNTWTGHNHFQEVDVSGSFFAEDGEFNADVLFHAPIVVGGGIELQVAASEVRVVTASPTPVAGWSLQFVSSVSSWTSTSTGAFLIVELDLPHAQELTAATVSIKGSATDVALPSSLPNLSVVMQPYTNSAGHTTLGTTTDAPANLAAYQAQHSLSVSGMMHTIDRTANRYFLALTSESGTNSNTGMTYLGAAVTFTRSTVGRD